MPAGQIMYGGGSTSCRMKMVNQRQPGGKPTGLREQSLPVQAELGFTVPV